MNLSKALMFARSPASGKLRFKLRTINNFLFALVIFVPFAIVASRVWSVGTAWLADVLAIALLFYFYHVFWNKRAIWIRCPTCRKQIATNTPWVCGACQAKNEHVDDFPFVDRCEACGVEPKAYQCHYGDCNKLIFFTEDELMRNYAFCINPPVVPTEREAAKTDFEKQKELLEYRKTLALLTREVDDAEWKQKEGQKKTRSPQEKIEESWANRRSHTISAAEIYRREKAANEKNFKDDPEMLEKANEALHEWYDSGDWERIL